MKRYFSKIFNETLDTDVHANEEKERPGGTENEDKAIFAFKQFLKELKFEL